jgi:hypothetical protein
MIFQCFYHTEHKALKTKKARDSPRELCLFQMLRLIFTVTTQNHVRWLNNKMARASLRVLGVLLHVSSDVHSHEAKPCTFAQQQNGQGFA